MNVLYNRVDAAEYLGIRPVTIGPLVYQLKLHPANPGASPKQWIFTQEELDRRKAAAVDGLRNKRPPNLTAP